MSRAQPGPHFGVSCHTISAPNSTISPSRQKHCHKYTHNYKLYKRSYPRRKSIDLIKHQKNKQNEQQKPSAKYSPTWYKCKEKGHYANKCFTKNLKKKVNEIDLFDEFEQFESCNSEEELCQELCQCQLNSPDYSSSSTLSINVITSSEELMIELTNQISDPDVTQKKYLTQMYTKDNIDKEKISWIYEHLNYKMLSATS